MAKNTLQNCDRASTINSFVDRLANSSKPKKTSKLPKPLELIRKQNKGIQKIHQASLIPYKKSKKKKLSLQQKEFNEELASIRIIIEHILYIFVSKFLK